jgi:hypothetical protein
MGEIFISYSTKDSDVATRLKEALEENGFTCWFAPNDIPLGGDYASRITQAIDHFRYVLVVVSQHSCQSEHVKREVSLAADNKKMIIPFKIDQNPLSYWMRYYISPVNWMEADEDIEVSISRLLQKIKGIDNLPQYEVNEVESHYGKSAQEVKASKGTATSKSYIYRIKEKEISRALSVYVSSPTISKAESILFEKRVLFLHSIEQTGKYTSSINLLKKTNVETFLEIFPSITEGELLRITFEENTGYIIDHIAPDTLNTLNDFSLKRLNEHLHRVNSYLIVTSDNSQLGNVHLTNQLVQHSPPSDMQALIENHLMQLKMDTSQLENLQKLIADSKLIQYISNNFLPRDTEELVKKLLAVSNGQQSIADLISSLKHNVNKRIVEWFEFDRNLEQYSLILALAVFNESQYQFLREKAHHLKVLLNDNPDEEQQNGTIFGTSLNQKLSEIHAETYVGLVNTTTGKLEDKFVRFKTKEDASAILLYVWNNYPHLKKVILTWFEGLVLNSHKQTNERVIQALSTLAKEDPLTIHKMIQDWANDKEPYYRTLAIHLLLEMSKQKENLATIDKLVNYWASLNNNSRLQWSAAVAYGTPLGIHLYPNSFLNLAAIFFYNGKRVGNEVYESMKNLFHYGHQDYSYFLSVPYMFNIWLKENEKDYEQKLRILNLFYSILMNIDNVALNVLLTDKEIRMTILPFWFAEGLRHVKSREEVKHVLKHMFKVADSFPLLHESLQTFTFALLVSGGTELKQSILTILKEIYSGPYKKAAKPILTKIIELERSTLIQ